MDCRIEIYLDGRWQLAAIFEPLLQSLDQGIEGECRMEYDTDYAVENLNRKEAELIPGLTVGFELFRLKNWPPFLIDLLPSGAGRRAWLRRMHMERDSPQADWHLLIKGAGNPPGALRVAEAVLPPPPNHYVNGFPRQDIIEQREDFLEYAAERGAHVAGASSVQGEAPKYLLAEDHAGMFHTEGALSDDKIKKFWLVKFPRGTRTDKRNCQILRNEAPYLEVARRFGIRTGIPLVYENDTLFVPRFDRIVGKEQVTRLGMHSLYALANIPGYGVPVRHDVYCLALAKVATAPARELREYILRDILNLALRNTDNHGRNTAILRNDTEIALSPIFDFAPMFLDPEGINRVSRWEDERPGSQPEWAAICEKLQYVLLDQTETRTWLAALSNEVQKLPDIMHACRVEDEIIERLTSWIGAVADGLKSADPRTIA
ncbi:MAG: type II toxin-antitoxin system HipA family toxin [Desulfuromusa sp.]|nr:type II toxin-antitoxin system HipA family toxin [Desulfuromusa sp.]